MGQFPSGNGKVLLECEPGSSQLGNPVPKRCGQVCMEVDRVDLFHKGEDKNAIVNTLSKIISDIYSG